MNVKQTKKALSDIQRSFEELRKRLDREISIFEALRKETDTVLEGTSANVQQNMNSSIKKSIEALKKAQESLEKSHQAIQAYLDSTL